MSNTQQVNINSIDANEDLSGAALLARLEIFSHLNPEVLAELSRGVEAVQYKEGDTVVAGGQFDGALLYGLVQGEARIVRTAANSSDLDMQEINAGEVVGAGRDAFLWKPWLLWTIYHGSDGSGDAANR